MSYDVLVVDEEEEESESPDGVGAGLECLSLIVPNLDEALLEGRSAAGARFFRAVAAVVDVAPDRLLERRDLATGMAQALRFGAARADAGRRARRAARDERISSARGGGCELSRRVRLARGGGRRVKAVTGAQIRGLGPGRRRGRRGPRVSGGVGLRFSHHIHGGGSSYWTCHYGERAGRPRFSTSSN